MFIALLLVVCFIVLEYFLGWPVIRFIGDHLPSGNRYPAGRISRGEVGIVGHRKMNLGRPQTALPQSGPDMFLGGITKR